MKYRKKPVVIEAYQFNKWDLNDFPKWLYDEIMSNNISANISIFPKAPSLKIKTLEGIMEAGIGWWIIKGIKGEIYACEPEIFELTYEKVE